MLMSKKSKVNMSLALLGRLISIFGSSIYSFAISFYILDLTGSAMSFSLSLLFSIIPMFLMSPVAGVLCDRLNRKKILLIADFVSGVTMVIMFIISQMIGQLDLWMIYLSSVLLSISSTFFSVSFMSAIPNMVSDEDLGRMNSLNKTMGSLATIMGPIIGGLIYASIDINIFLLINGLSFLLSMVQEMFINFRFNVKEINQEKTEVEGKEKAKKSVLKEMKATVSYLNTKQKVMTVIKAAFFLNFLYTSVAVGLPKVIVLDMGGSELALSWVQSILSVGMLLASLYMATIKNLQFDGKRCALALAGIGLSVGGIAIPGIIGGFNTDISLIVYFGVGAFLAGTCIIFVNVPFETLMHQGIEDEYRGRVMAVIGMAVTAITPLGYLLHGFLLDYVHSSFVFLYVCISYVIISLYVFIKLKQIEARETMMENAC